ncbi:hypothetical protein NC651_019269 [Populus alba x Populus x berolinensis]|nr:hypothetical protein NC651_019269 [Populus alba x Populus x berolinensis]
MENRRNAAVVSAGSSCIPCPPTHEIDHIFFIRESRSGELVTRHGLPFSDHNYPGALPGEQHDSIHYTMRKDIVTVMTEVVSNISPPPGSVATVSDAPPIHYMVKIESFSSLGKNAVETYESGVFEAGGYKWLDAAGKERRFHGLNLQSGFDQFIKLSTFNDARYGFLLEDTCVLGAEVFVCGERSRGKGEVLSMTKYPPASKYTWKIVNFSKLDEKRQESQIFSTGDHKWKIVLYPKGKGLGMGTHLSLYLALDLETLPAGCRVYVDYTLRLVDQVYARQLDRYDKAKSWFGASSSENGWSRYGPLSLYQSHDYLFAKDICIIEAEVIVLGIGSPF